MTNRNMAPNREMDSPSSDAMISDPLPPEDDAARRAKLRRKMEAEYEAGDRWYADRLKRLGQPWPFSKGGRGPRG